MSKFKLNILLVIILFSNALSIVAQNTNDSEVKGEFIVQFENEAYFKAFETSINNQRTPTLIVTRLAHLAPIIKIKNPDLEWEDFIAWISNFGGVKFVQKNFYTEIRKTPNDPLFGSSQWNMSLINAPKAWDITTGGVTPVGDTIVVAVLDDGFLITHPDLKDNIFVNHHEIPNNNVDDDGNGVIDDINGWNIVTKSGNLGEPRTHGTGVLGIIAAKGNNNQGISGVNWNVKILPISGGAGTGSTLDLLITGFDYVANMRKMYNESNGASGAFIVASSFSAGVRNKFEEDVPIVCNMYNIMGEQGVLSIGATTNEDVNVDVMGDFPSLCSSKYLIITTNVNKNDVKVQKAGYSAVNVDLGAPGDGNTSTALNNNYGPFGGTSCATPHVSGAVALIYSYPELPLKEIYINNPSLAATTVKNAILKSVSHLTSLEGITTSGGRLNLENITRYYTLDTQNTLKFNFKVKPSLVSNKITIEYDVLTNIKTNIIIWDMLGRMIKSESIDLTNTNKKSFDVDVSQLSPAQYFIQVNNNEVSGTFKFIKI